ncbi:hypothetical protein C8F04DRAFT_472821 [Mycena alexandri]|uniref:Uncharacterized protein n=1 Tax=Mycena alexandri TaxID=1745969 RepID=A0AAD6SZ98_9AGAR|nr:hypothetical protein C8F04DRAFT_472821 [Mycena alexandri]
MELGFSVKRGPLTQISLPILGLDTAVHLAVGAYGWWKARERHMSLAHQLETNGAHLTTVTSFNRTTYLSAREGTAVRGAAMVQQGALSSVQLPNASTAKDDAAMCIRALVTALFCFFTEEGVTEIVSNVMPDFLLRYDLDDVKIPIDGALRAALRQYIVTVQTEEDSDSLRQRLLERVQVMCGTVTQVLSPDDMAADNILDGDGHLMICLIRWVLTSAHKRKEEWYPTRSMRVWSLAIVLESIGFDIHAYPTPAATEEVYLQHSSPTAHYGGHSQVVLVTAPVGDTDPGESDIPKFGARTKAQYCPIQAIPLILFRHLSSLGHHYKDDYITVDHLYEVWQFAFDSAAEGVDEPYLDDSETSLVCVSLREDIAQECTGVHKPIVGLWSKYMSCIMGKAFQKYILKPIDMEAVRTFNDGVHRFQVPVQNEMLYHGGEGFNVWHIAVTAILATVYAIASKALLVDGQPSTRMTSIAFSPEILYERKIKSWAQVVGSALVNGAAQEDWSALLMELATGGAHPHNLPSVGPAGNMDRVSAVLGMQANGVAALLDLVVAPSVSSRAAVMCHVQLGQMCTIALDEGGYVRASSATRPAKNVLLPVVPNKSSISAAASDAVLRVDVEPDWAGDPRTTVFQTRVDGINLATFSPLIVLRWLMRPYWRIACSCGAPVSTADVNVNEAWRDIHVSQLAQYARLSRVEFKLGTRVHVPVTSSEEAKLLCIGCIESEKIFMADECLKCALDVVPHVDHKSSLTVILLSAIEPQVPDADRVSSASGSGAVADSQVPTQLPLQFPSRVQTRSSGAEAMEY